MCSLFAIIYLYQYKCLQYKWILCNNIENLPEMVLFHFVADLKFDIIAKIFHESAASLVINDL